MPVPISVVIPAHNPDANRLVAVLAGLRNQTLPGDQWEGILVDNASAQWPPSRQFEETGLRNLRIVREPQLGLAAARRCGLLQSNGQIIVFVDDDNVLAPDYLDAVAAIFSAYPQLGVAGGKVIPSFESTPPDWLKEFFSLLALRDLGDVPLVAQWTQAVSETRREYPAISPIGAGMLLRREAGMAWLDYHHGRLPIRDRVGATLSSAGDCDIVVCALRAGWQVGYFPQLRLTHLIPASRLRPEYLQRLNWAIQRSWTRLLLMHGISPWPPLSRAGASVRMVKAWCKHRPWRSPEAAIRWRGACGHFEGRVTTSRGTPFPPVSFPRRLARRFGLGRLNYFMWHAPLEQVRRSRAAGGPREQLRDRQERRAMIRAATELLPARWATAESLPELHLLTGKDFWYQAAFCLRSLEIHSGQSFRTVFHDDGTLAPSLIAQIRMIFPHALVESHEEADTRLARILPRDRFPVLHERRKHYPQLRKLIDVHAGRSGWRLSLDSDMLFFRRPDDLLGWLRQPSQPVHLSDIQNSYGYSAGLLEEIAGTALPSKVNVGILGLDSSRIDWDEIENWCRRLLTAEGTSYYLEQALAAMLLARVPSTRLAERDYIVCPTRDDCFPPRGVLHHYVAESKRWYFRHTWRACGVSAATRSERTPPP